MWPAISFFFMWVHYHLLVSAKIPSLKLRNGYGNATYNESTKFIDYPVKTPVDRLPSNAPRKVKVGFADAKAWLSTPCPRSQAPEERIKFFVDSGAGQSMSACSEAFHTLHDCAILVVGVAGSMPAHGIGTACFVVKSGDTEFILRIHNCLLCHRKDKFNLISVSQALRPQHNEITFVLIPE